MKYQPRRNIVHRHSDGKAVNVARFRGHLFVCANACCCGREDLTNAPVNTALYNDEWLRRRLRNFVHLTVGGCLGPCALANVAMLTFDGRTTWFHSVNDDATQARIFDYIESLLDSDGEAPIPAELRRHVFTASTSEPRPDGQPIDEFRRWRGRSERPDATPACEMPFPEGTVPDAIALQPPAYVSGRLTAALSGETAIPRANGEPVFAAPWEARAFGMAAAMEEAGLFTWNEFRDHLIAAIARAEESTEPFVYYACWLEALESVLEGRAIVPGDLLAERTHEFEFGERSEIY